MKAEAADPSVKLAYQHGVTTQILISIFISEILRYKQSLFLNYKSNTVRTYYCSCPEDVNRRLLSVLLKTNMQNKLPSNLICVGVKYFTNLAEEYKLHNLTEKVYLKNSGQLWP